MKIIFIPCYSKKDPCNAVKKALDSGKLTAYKKIGLVATAQHINQRERIEDILKKNSKEVFFGGQVLGCDQVNAKTIENEVDAFLYIGSGRFHPTGIAISTKKPVIIANPYSNSIDEISDSEKKKYVRRRRGHISRAIEAGIFGILVSTKRGQFDLNSALELKKKIEANGKHAFLFAGNEINPDNVLGFEVDAWINTACPRIVDDHFKMPVLNPWEVTDTGLI